MRRLLILLWCGCAVVSVCLGQVSGYVHYDVNSGLAGATAYTITQDKEGFLWMATSGGLCRYDGTNFVTYTVADGLPANEIITVFADSQNRIWFAPFKREVGYYYQGKIYTRKNSSLLRSISLTNIVASIQEDTEGSIFFIQSATKCKVTKSNAIVYHADHAGCFAPLLASKQVRHAYVNSYYHIISDLKDSVWVYACQQKLLHRFKLQGSFQAISFVAKDRMFVNTSNGAYAYNLQSGKQMASYLEGQVVTSTFEDHEHNLWFSTFENGVYKKNNFQPTNFLFRNTIGYDKGIYSFQEIDGQLYAANETLWQVELNAESQVLQLHKILITDSLKQFLGRTTYFTSMPNGHMVMASNRGMFDIDRQTHRVCYKVSQSVKDIWMLDKQRWLVAGPGFAYVLEYSKWEKQEEYDWEKAAFDIVWPTRTTAVAARNDTLFIGTLEGLYLKHGTNLTYLGAGHPALSQRISCIRPATDGSVWIATYESGVVQWKNGRIVHHFTQSNGLSSNSCTQLTLYKNTIWVATDKGVTRLTSQPDGYHATIFNIHTGLSSNLVNCIYIYMDQAYIGTSTGISVFPWQLTPARYTPRLTFLGAGIESDPLHLQSAYEFVYPHNQQIRFVFAGISYTLDGAMRYAYRLVGLDNKWRFTTQSMIEYASLPAGRYSLQVKAYNGMGKESRPIQIPFEVIPAVWQRGWFQVLAVCVCMAVGMGSVYLRFRHLRQRTLDQNRLNSQLVELKHRALKAQMNPHFIFNCLNSVQRFLFIKEKEHINLYISTLAKVIRQTMNLTSHNSIPLHEEITYLTHYLELEQMRFEGEFDYQIDFNPESPCSQWHIPSMIVQPYVENSIRHGIRYKKEDDGWIRVAVCQTDETLTITVTDNGVGRQNAALYKSKQHIEYQSKGTSLTAERLELLNKNYLSAQKASVDIQDFCAQASDVGTQVTITFPLEMLNHLIHDTSHTY